MSREYEGTGLGLAVTKKATEEMGGSVEVETQKGEGSRFTVRLPLRDSVEDGDVESNGGESR
jgi:signal transduction histidine kinase